MSFSDSSQAQLVFKKETVFGTAMTGVNFDEFRFTGESLNFNVETAESQEINASRQVSDLIRTNAGAGGDVNIEMSYASFHPLLEALMLSAWQDEVTIPDTELTDAVVNEPGKTITTAVADFLSPVAGDPIVVGQWIRIVSTTNTGYYQVKTITSTVITLEDPPADEVLVTASAEAMSINGSRLLIGTTKQSFTIEEQFSDVSQFFVYNGMRVGSLNLDVASEAIITGAFNFEGLSVARDTSTTTTGTDSAGGNDVMSAVANVANIRKDGVLSTHSAQSLTFALENALRSQTAVGTLGAVGVGVGRANVNGDMNIYFEDGVQFDDYANGTEFSLDFRLQDNDGNAYVINMPRCKFASLTIDAGSIDEDVMASGTYQALLPSTGNILSSVQIDRLPNSYLDPVA